MGMGMPTPPRPGYIASGPMMHPPTGVGPPMMHPPRMPFDGQYLHRPPPPGNYGVAGGGLPPGGVVVPLPVGPPITVVPPPALNGGVGQPRATIETISGAPAEVAALGSSALPAEVPVSSVPQDQQQGLGDGVEMVWKDEEVSMEERRASLPKYITNARGGFDT